jgi:small subunit ribosomal protein S6
MNRIYEEMFILRPDATEEEIAPIVEQVKTTVTSAGGTVDKEERWGVRKLAYRVEKRNEGYYVLMQFTAGPQTVKEVERRLRVNDAVLKYMTVRIDEKLKKIEKRKKEREKRAARKPAPVVAAPAPIEGLMPASPVPGAPMPGAPAPGAPAPEAEAAAPETTATPTPETQE